MPEETLERAHDRIQLICEKIRTETLDPAREEAERIIDEAHKEAARIREQAKRDSEKMQTELKKSLEEE
ncbi:MAG TPA: hypothetical protein VN457_05785, partial [Chlamydiales bacterium]|nr:hypothetical protein [Chlamydiales bacterium]